jgi:hypothetical protein
MCAAILVLAPLARADPTWGRKLDLVQYCLQYPQLGQLPTERHMATAAGLPRRGTCQALPRNASPIRDIVILANPSRVAQGDRVTHLLYDVVGTTQGKP